MKRSSAIFIVLGCACFLLLATTIVIARDAEPTVRQVNRGLQHSVVVTQSQDAESTVNQLASELQESGVVTQSEAEAIRAPLKNMIEKGASKEELKSVVAELSNKEVKGDDLKQSVDSMNDLVNEGGDPKEVGSVVSQTVAQAHAEGLKGKDLAAKVHEAIEQHKAQRDAAKKKAEEAKKEGQEKAEKTKKETSQKGKGKKDK